MEKEGTRAEGARRRTPESMAWRPHRVEFVFGQESGLRASQETRTGGLQSSPERAAAPHRPPGTWRPFLGPEKRRGNLGVNFANFALGAGEAAGRNGATAVAGRDAQGGPRARAGHPGASRNAQGGA
nr:uncharacterized protein LOC112428919 isoform X1 [Macaca nemestrina]